MTLYCKSCGHPFEAHFHNAMYCDECKVLRRKQSSRDAWQRKKAKIELDRIRGSKYQIALQKLEMHHMEEMGMSYGKYEVWKHTCPDQYAAWRTQQEIRGALPEHDHAV